MRSGEVKARNRHASFAGYISGMITKSFVSTHEYSFTGGSRHMNHRDTSYNGMNHRLRIWREALAMGVPGLLNLLHEPSVNRPRSVILGIYLYLLALSLGMPTVAINMAKSSSFSSAIVSLTTFAIFAAIALWVTRKIYLGRNWARVIFLVLFLLGLVGLILDDLQPEHIQHQVGVFLFWVQTLLSGTSVVMWFLPSSNRWFRYTQSPDRKLGEQP